MKHERESTAVWIIEGRYPDDEVWRELSRKSCEENTIYDAGMFRDKNPGLEVRVRLIDGDVGGK